MNTSRWPKVILLGDSLTERSFEDGQWGAILQDKLQRKCDVINRGHGGYNSTWIKVILPDIINQEILKEVEVISMVIFIGANDSTSPGEDLHVPIATYKYNLQGMVDYLKTIDVKQIILITPPPVNESVISTCCRGKWKTDELAEDYSEVCRNVAKENGVLYVDLYHAILAQKNWRTLLHDDGVHLSVTGAQFLESELWPLIDKQANKCEMKFPIWQEFESYEAPPRELISPKMIKQLTMEEPEDYRYS